MKSTLISESKIMMRLDSMSWLIFCSTKFQKSLVQDLASWCTVSNVICFKTYLFFENVCLIFLVQSTRTMFADTNSSEKKS